MILLIQKITVSSNALLIIIQLIAYILSLGLALVQLTFTTEILFVVFPGISLIAKVVRQVKKKHWKSILQSQLQFYIVYLLTAFQCAFYGQLLFLVYGPQRAVLIICGIVAANINYSLLANHELTSRWQTIIYSFGQILHISHETWATINLIMVIDQSGEEGLDLLKDFMLLTTTTAIAAGAVILDLMYRGYEKAVENSHENRHEIKDENKHENEHENEVSLQNNEFHQKLISSNSSA